MAGRALALVVTCILAAGPWAGSLAGAADGGPPAGEGQVPQRASYLIGVGDNLEIAVWKNPDVSRKVWVRPDGRITLPLVGEITAEGVSSQELARVIKEKLKEFLEDPVVTVSLETMGTATAVPVRITSSASQPAAAESADKKPSSAESVFRIGVEDVLDISVWRNTELSRQVWIRPDGKASLPLIGEFRAEGLSPEELAKVLEKRLRAFFADPVVTVGVVEINSYTVYLMGLVKTPGALKFRSPRTFLQVLSMAGGFQEFADSGSVSLVRWEDGKQKRIPVDARKIIAKGTDADFVVKPGDVIIVP